MTTILPLALQVRAPVTMSKAAPLPRTSPQRYKRACAFRSCVAKDRVLNINDFLCALLYQPGDIWLGHSEQF